jgi:hypothetical protein
MHWRRKRIAQQVQIALIWIIVLEIDALQHSNRSMHALWNAPSKIPGTWLRFSRMRSETPAVV